MVAAMTSGRILTFIGDVSRTSNALKSIQASREGCDLSYKKDMLTRSRSPEMARSGTSPRSGYKRQSQGYRTRWRYGDRARGSYHRIVRIAAVFKATVILIVSLVTSHSQNVDLRYPSRPDALAVQNLSLTFQPGVSYAFCGASGSGKSR
jgi:ABC-type multidrug transport system fused ATPase/permease subunit